MGFMDDVYRGTKRTMDSVGRLAGTTYEYSKLKMSILSLNEKLSRKYSELGKLAFDSLENGSDLKESSLGTVEDIKYLNNQIQEKLDQLSELRNEKNCPACGAKNSKNADYCTKCGVKLD